jgi:hypothetical protein
MNLSILAIRSLLLGVGCMALAATDPRVVRCDRPYLLTIKSADGNIEVGLPGARTSLKTLARPGDQFLLQPGQDYIIYLNQSGERLFHFGLAFIPVRSGPAWSCQVQSIPFSPFIRLDQAGWTVLEGAGQAIINLHPDQPLIILAPPGTPAPPPVLPPPPRTARRPVPHGPRIARRRTA